MQIEVYCFRKYIRSKLFLFNTQYNELSISQISFSTPMRTLTRTKLRLRLHNNAPLYRT